MLLGRVLRPRCSRLRHPGRLGWEIEYALHPAQLGRGLELLVALVHGLILRLQALLLPFQNLVFSGH
jgi:hypothetical protein